MNLRFLRQSDRQLRPAVQRLYGDNLGLLPVFPAVFLCMCDRKIFLRCCIHDAYRQPGLFLQDFGAGHCDNNAHTLAGAVLTCIHAQITDLRT